MKRELSAVYNNIRSEERQALDARVREALRRAPILHEIAEERAAVMRQVGERTVTLNEGKAALAALTMRETKALVDAGLPPDTLNIHYRCPDCQDTGYLDGDRQRPCKCQLSYAAKLDMTDSINGKETFEGFLTEIYPNEQQKQQALRAREFCKNYADTLPKPEKPNLLILGANGLGKSYLSNAIARRAIERGVDAARVTAYRFTQDILEDIRSGAGNALRYQRVPLFVLDDLGSEPVIPNVSKEWLFAIINERMLHEKATVIVTNLEYETLGSRYGDRLLSRFVNRQTTVSLRLTGRDLRLGGC